ncbi:MerR family transcriptional regulator [Escherichia coli]|uniref:MerR family transcriptional regulator n=1 Tax=Escherichia coli TaxID=562 RepID=UPI000DDE70D3|nr:YfeC-like transcriptional regulator [Escherichia coli]
MKRLRNKMTTEELAECLGVAKQTVNRWIREKGWKTEKFPGVKGGRARLILVDTQVCEFIQNTPAFHNTPMLMEAEERIAEYAPGARAPAYRQIINAIDNMTDIEQEKVAQLLSREGIRNFLARLDIDESA